MINDLISIKIFLVQNIQSFFLHYTTVYIMMSNKLIETRPKKQFCLAFCFLAALKMNQTVSQGTIILGLNCYTPTGR